MKYKVFNSDLSELVHRYRCVVNGNEVVSVTDNKKTIRRVCERYSNKGFYTELWCDFKSGRSVLCNYWN